MAHLLLTTLRAAEPYAGTVSCIAGALYLAATIAFAVGPFRHAVGGRS